jgi:hypothetical protein
MDTVLLTSADRQSTYDDLIAYHRRNTPDLVKQQRLNRESALTLFRNSVGATGDLIGEELGARFEEHLNAFLKEQTKASKSKGTRASTPTHCRRY